MLAPQGIKPGDTMEASRTEQLDMKPGNAMPLDLMPVGTVVHNIEMQPGKGGILCRSAGTSGRLLEKYTDKGMALIRLASKEQRMVPVGCMATVGEVSNELHKLRVYGKAGAMRWRGKRPQTRGKAMNPVDHPNGGGEGGHSSYSGTKKDPWGKPSRGVPTRRKKKKSSAMIVTPRKAMK